MSSADLEERIARLTPEQRVLLERKLSQTRSPGRQPPALRRRARGAHVPASFAQRRLWYLDRLAPGTARYNVALVFRLSGPLDADALGAAIGALVRRHEALRTRLVEIGGEPQQVVDEPDVVALSVVEPFAAQRGDREAEALDLVAAAGRVPFDTEAEPPFRAQLVRIAPDDHVLALTVHHAAIDGFSIGIMLEDLSALYAAQRHGSGEYAAATPIEYADFAAWEQERADAGDFEPSLAYWRERIANDERISVFPGDRVRPEQQATRGSAHEKVIAPELYDAIGAFAREHAVTPFTVLLAAFAAHLRRYADGDRIVVAIPTSDRSVSELQRVVGMFVNTLPIVLDVPADMTFEELVAHVHASFVAALAHDVPFDLLVRRLAPRRRANAAPIAEVMFAHQADSTPTLDLPGIDARPVASETGTVKFDVTLDTVESDGGLRCVWSYADEIYERTTVERFAQEYLTLLACGVSRPRTAVSALALHSDTRREALLGALRGEDRPFSDRCLDELIHERAQAQPDATAVVCATERISYCELDERAARLAARLRARGVGRDHLVAVLLDPSVAMIVTVLAVLQAGAAYLPLDARYPADRMRVVLDDAQPVVAVTEPRYAHRFAGVEVVEIDAEERSTERGAAYAGAEARSNRDLAYVMYTSGSTGIPKGVCVEHRSVVAFIDAFTAVAEIVAGDVFLQFGSLCFDVSVEEIFCTLAAGATIAIAGPEMRASSPEFIRGCERLGVTVMDLPTAFWHVLVDDVATNGLRLPAACRLAITGGEAMAPAAARTWLAHTRIPLANAYGPTEATIAATMGLVQHVDVNATAVPVGSALANVYLYVLDASLQPVPRGATGMLFIGGAGVARGYHRRPELTARTFVPDVHRGDGSRMYMTGDLARIESDGSLTILGREDGQVKVRGFRVETGDVEAALLRHPGVRRCAVVSQAGISGENRLVAYVVTASSGDTERTALETFMRGVVPEYMVPAVAIVDALPITLNGKLDRAALPPVALPAGPDTTRAAPQDMFELILARIWEELLDVRPIGTRDNFFALGGHSLLAARMMSRVEQRTGIRLPIAALFTAQTIESIAAVLRRATVHESRPLLQLQAGDAGAPVFFLDNDYEGGGLYCARVAEGLGRDRSMFIVRPHGLDGCGEVQSIEAMAVERVAAIRAVQPHGPYVIGGYCTGGVTAYEIARTLRAQGAEVPLLILVDAPRNARRRPVLGAAVRTSAVLRRWSADRELEAYVRWQRRIDYVRNLTARERVTWLTRAVLRGPSPGGGEHPVEHRISESLERYTPEPYGGRTLLIGCSGLSSRRRRIAWKRLAPAATESVIAGDHDALAREHARAIGERIRVELDGLTADRR